MSLASRFLLLLLLLMCASFSVAQVVPQAGWWYNPNAPGTGVFLEDQNGYVFLTTQVYDAGGQATWTIATGSMSGSTFAAPLQTFCCGQTLGGPFQPNKATGTAGNISITFSDTQHGTMTWPGGTVPIQRLSFTSSPTAIAPQAGAPQPGWWWNPNQSGTAFHVDIQGSNIFADAMVYSSTGSAIWYLAYGGMQSPTLFQGQWNEYCCGQTLSGPYQPNQLKASAGSTTFQFTSATTGVVSFANGTQIPIQRFHFGSPTPPPPPPPPPSGGGSLTSINHIVFKINENRSFDHYFAKINEYRAMSGLGADVDELPPGVTNPRVPDYAPVGSFHLKTMCIENTSAAWYVSHQDYNLFDISSNTPTMDGFVWSGSAAAYNEGGNDTSGSRAMGYYDFNDLPYYYFMATQFGLSDRWFSPGPMETEPSKMYVVAATSVGHAHAPKTSVNARTIFDLLNSAGISWKIYYENQASDAIYNYFQPSASQNASHVVPISQYFADLQAGTLPNVAMIEPGFGSQDEHPGVGNNLQLGVAGNANIINSLMRSSSWQDSVFILVYDETGSLYDHVPPPNNVPNPDGIPPQDLFSAAQNGYADPPGDFTRYGFRIPNLVISPFTKPHYVSHVVTDSTSILKLIETRWGLPNLTRRDAVASDLTDFFDFANKPWATPPNPPPQPTNGPCYDSLP
jgi:phospholipase C